MDANARFPVTGCLQDYSWCSVVVGNTPGWASAPYLVTDAGGKPTNLQVSGAQLGIPIVVPAPAAAVVATPPVGAMVPTPALVEPILPPEDCAFVVKARHTVFYGTPLEYLLWQRDVGHIVLTGQVTEQCILYSALDAYVRHLEVTVPHDAVAHIHESLADAALEMMERNMGARISAAGDL